MTTAPVEYAVAVGAFLAQAPLSPASRRVYRISLDGWAWPLTGQSVPAGPQRRRARPPVVPLALLDQDETRARLAGALAHRCVTADARTVRRELSALRSAIAWWLGQGWIGTDPTSGLDLRVAPAGQSGPLGERELAALAALPAALREQALWQLLLDTGVPAATALALDAGDVHVSAGRQVRIDGELRPVSARTARLLSWLLAGRRDGPVFLTARRAPAGTPAADVCPVTGRARLSYRRAAEVLTAATSPLDAAGRGWTLHQLRRPR